MMTNQISWGNLSLRWKMLTVFLLAGLIPFGIGSITTLYEGSSALEERAFEGLDAVRYAKQVEIREYLYERKVDAQVMADTVATSWADTYDTIHAVQSLQKRAIEKYFADRYKVMDDVKQSLRYTEGLPLFKAAFAKGAQSDDYKRLDRERNKGFKVFQDNFGFHDIYLIDKNGRVVYSLLKQSDFGQNMNDSKWKGTGLGKAFAKSREDVAIEDFSFYGPSKSHAAFMAVPLLDRRGRYAGSAAFQLLPDELNSIVQTRTGFDSKTESYLVGLVDGKKLLRSTRVVKKGSFDNKKKGKDVDTVLAGKSGDFIKVGSTGNTELSVHKALDIKGLTWGIITSVNVEESFVPKLEGETEDFFAKYLKNRGYYDIYMITPEGQIFYSVKKQDDFKTNIVNGKYADTHLSKLFRQVLRTKEFGIVDFEPYKAIGGEPAAFMAEPIIINDRIELVVVMQLPTSHINRLMQDVTGLGETGETFLVGEDLLMRTDSRFEANSTILKKKVDTYAVRQALKGVNGTSIFDDYRGISVLGSYSPVGLREALGADFDWVVVAEIEEGEALQAVATLKLQMLAIAVIMMIVITFVALIVTRAIAGPIVRMADTIRNIAVNKDLTLSVDVQGRDEIGTMSDAFNSMMSSIRDVFALVTASANDVSMSSQDMSSRASSNRQRSEEELKRAQMSEKVITEMGGTAGEVSSASNEQQLAAQSAGGVITQMQEQIKQVAASADEQREEVAVTMDRIREMGETGAKVVATAEEQGATVNEVTASVDEMIASVDEMHRAVGEATNSGRASLAAAEEGSRSVEATVEGMKAIAESSEQISEIIGVITEIAEQTNLLALNAAIEAARAGAHGKGFAVVADEVGKLAQRSSEAAQEITQLIKDSAQRVEEGTRLTKQSQEALTKIDEGGNANMQAIEKIGQRAETLTTSSRVVQEMMAELNTLAQKIGSMAGEQGQRRAAAETALNKLQEMSDNINALVDQANDGALQVAEQMSGIVNRTTDMTGMTEMQRARSEAIMKIARESAKSAKQTAEGATEVVGITEQLHQKAENLNNEVNQFKVS